MSSHTRLLPRHFILSRLHSLTGLLIVIFLIEHMLTNSQAALFFNEDGAGFVRMVNFIKSLPYLPVIEIMLIGIPIAYHAVLGIRYAIQGKFNVHSKDGSSPSLPYGRNIAYTFQRLTAWILLVGIIAHVAFMRFAIYPIHAQQGSATEYFVKLSMDQGLYTLTDRLGVVLYDQHAVEEKVKNLKEISLEIEKLHYALTQGNTGESDQGYSEQAARAYQKLQALQLERDWIEKLAKRPIDAHHVIGASKDFGTATLLNVRDAFKSPVKIALYTIFVLAASFHGFNGLWTFMMTWGVMITRVSQKKALRICIIIMALIAFLGLISIYGTYLMNLKS